MSCIFFSWKYINKPLLLEIVFLFIAGFAVTLQFFLFYDTLCRKAFFFVVRRKSKKGVMTKFIALLQNNFQVHYFPTINSTSADFIVY